MENLKLQINDLSVAYTPEKLAVKHVTTGILERTITAIMGRAVINSMMFINAFL